MKNTMSSESLLKRSPELEVRSCRVCRRCAEVFTAGGAAHIAAPATWRPRNAASSAPSPARVYELA